ncbi:MAG: hypothetical protein WC526_00850 [Patescibacteria group bacterium]
MWYLNLSGLNMKLGPFTTEGLRDALSKGVLRADTVVEDTGGRRSSVGDIVGAPGTSTLENVILGALAVGGAAAILHSIFGKKSRVGISKEERNSILRSGRVHERQGALLVCMDHVPAACPPPKVGRRRPDLVAYYDDKIVAEEHETIATVFKKHSVEQNRDLRRETKRCGWEYRQVIAELPDLDLND